MKKSLAFLIVCSGLGVASVPTVAAAADDVIRPASERFAADGGEVPHFRRHVVALVGRLGCNGRACHGSFQGKGDFRLSLFGYDFAEDHKNLLAGDSTDGVPRANVKEPAASLMLRKPTLQTDHEGGERMKVGSWQYRLLLKWINSGAANLPRSDAELSALEVTPKEIVFQKPGETVQLRAIARWADGTREDVTCLCRFKSNNEQVAKIDEAGKVTASEVGRHARGRVLRQRRAADPRDPPGLRPGRREVPARADADEDRRAGGRQAAEAGRSCPPSWRPTPSSSAASAST